METLRSPHRRTTRLTPAELEDATRELNTLEWLSEDERSPGPFNDIAGRQALELAITFRREIDLLSAKASRTPAPPRPSIGRRVMGLLKRP